MKKLFLVLPVLFITLFVFSNTAQAVAIIPTETFSSLAAWTISGTAVSNSGAPATSPVGDPYAYISANSDIHRTISTLTYQNITLKYYRTTDALEGGGTDDNLLAQWKLTSSGSWNTLETVTKFTSNDEWSQVFFNLPASADNASIDLRFQVNHNGGNADDFGLIDSVELLAGSQTSLGSTIPEPATFSLLGLGLLGLLRFRKK